MWRTKRQSTNFVENGSKANEIEKSASDYSFFIGYCNYIKNVTIEKIQICGREVPMMRDNGASLTLISTKSGQQIGELKLEEMASEIEPYDNHKMQDLVSFFSKVLCENKLIGAKIAVVKADKLAVVGPRYTE